MAIKPPIPPLVLFGQNILRVRKNAGINQEELSFRCKLDRSYISDIENGKRNISVLNILKLACALKVHPKELLNYPGADIKPESICEEEWN